VLTRADHRRLLQRRSNVVRIRQDPDAHGREKALHHSPFNGAAAKPPSLSRQLVRGAELGRLSA